jgi:hypothetical protein
MSVVVHTGHCISLGRIPTHAEVVDTRERDQTAWAWARPEIANAGNKDPVAQ